MELSSVAAIALVLAASQVSALAPRVAAPAPVGLPNCTTTCGNVSVPYPFGLGPPGCSHPVGGFNLTCDTSHTPPRLLLGDGTLRVVEIDIRLNIVRVVVRTGGGGEDDGVWSLGGGFGDSGPFFLASDGVNALVLTGCNVQAMLYGANGSLLCGCSSFCSISDQLDHNTLKHCYGVGCCNMPIPVGRTSFDVRLKGLVDADNNGTTAHSGPMPVHVFVTDIDWIRPDELGRAVIQSIERIQRHDAAVEAPMMLGWAIWPSEAERAKRAGATVNSTILLSKCTDVDAANSICKSRNSSCGDTGRGYTCHCAQGYDGNPYLPDGCQDVNECENPDDYGCFGECRNTDGWFECRCRPGTHGDHTIRGGCVNNSSSTGLIAGISVGAGAGSVLLVLTAIFMTKRFKYIRAMKLKQKYFKQNRGQLLQQLVSQRADIAERMIIPVDELAKATNHFDKARELGGGGHGTVYKGILSDLHVVAIKKPKIAVQKEIDEFINEVAILSQINHKNVVKLFGCCLETEVPLLVYEFISNGTLYHHLHVEGPRSLSWSARLRVATETSGALAYLHSSVSTPIIHRDIKSSNILLDDTSTAKVSDFGASRYVPVDKTGLTTRVQGTIGYLDPMYFYTGRLTEKSDVYSFGVILVELLTRKKPFSYLSSEGDGLVAHFINLLDEGNLVQILDPQVKEEGGKEVQEVAELAASCIKLSGEDRPTMRQVEHKLEGLLASKKYVKDNMVAEEFEESASIVMDCPSTKEAQRRRETSRRYSLEQDILMSARYPR